MFDRTVMYIDCFENEINQEIVPDHIVEKLQSILSDPSNVVEICNLACSHESIKKLFDAHITDTYIALCFVNEKSDSATDRVFYYEYSTILIEVIEFQNVLGNKDFIDSIKFKAFGQADLHYINENLYPLIVLENESSHIEDTGKIKQMPDDTNSQRIVELFSQTNPSPRKFANKMSKLKLDSPALLTKSSSDTLRQTNNEQGNNNYREDIYNFLEGSPDSTVKVSEVLSEEALHNTDAKFKVRPLNFSDEALDVNLTAYDNYNNNDAANISDQQEETDFLNTDTTAFNTAAEFADYTVPEVPITNDNFLNMFSGPAAGTSYQSATEYNTASEYQSADEDEPEMSAFGTANSEKFYTPRFSQSNSTFGSPKVDPSEYLNFPLPQDAVQYNTFNPQFIPESTPNLDHDNTTHSGFMQNKVKNNLHHAAELHNIQDKFSTSIYVDVEDHNEVKENHFDTSEKATDDDFEEDSDNELLVIPVSKPYFPNTNVKNLKVRNPILKQAILQLLSKYKTNQCYANENKNVPGSNYGLTVGLFFIKNSLFTDNDLIKNEGDIHDVGVSARIVSYGIFEDLSKSIQNKNDGEVLLLNLEIMERIKIDRLKLPSYFTKQDKHANSKEPRKKSTRSLKEYAGVHLNELVTFAKTYSSAYLLSDPSYDDRELNLVKKYSTNSLMLLRKILRIFKDYNPRIFPSHDDTDNGGRFYGFKKDFENAFEVIFCHYDVFVSKFNSNNILNFFNCYQDNLDLIIMKNDFLIEILRNYLELKFSNYYKNSSDFFGDRKTRHEANTNSIDGTGIDDLYSSLYNNNRQDYFNYYNSKLQTILSTDDVYRKCKLISKIFKNEAAILQFEETKSLSIHEDYTKQTYHLNTSKKGKADYYGDYMNVKPTKSTQDANSFANEPFRMKSSVSSPNFAQSVNTNEHPFTNTYGIGRNAKQRQQENHCFFNPEAQAHSHVDADFSYSKSFENEIGDKENSNRFNKSKPFSSRSYFNLSDFMNSSKQTQHDRYNNIYDQLYDTKRF